MMASPNTSTNAPPASRPAATDDGDRQCNVYVASLPLKFTNAELRQLTEPYGRIVSLRMFTDTKHVGITGHSYGFVLYSAPEEAAAAVAALHDMQLGDRRLQVRLSKSGKRSNTSPGASGSSHTTSGLHVATSPPTSHPGSMTTAIIAGAPPGVTLMTAAPMPHHHHHHHHHHHGHAAPGAQMVPLVPVQMPAYIPSSGAASTSPGASANAVLGASGSGNAFAAVPQPVQATPAMAPVFFAAPGAPVQQHQQAQPPAGAQGMPLFGLQPAWAAIPAAQHQHHQHQPQYQQQPPQHHQSAAQPAVWGAVPPPQ